MDLSIIEKVFALREEMEKAQFGIDVPELPGAESADGAELFKRLEQLPDTKEAVRLMDRAATLDAQSDKWHEAARAPGQRLRPEIVDLLTAASAPLPVFTDAELTSVGVPPVRAEPIVPRAPSIPTRHEAVAEPFRDAAPRVADATAKKPARKAAKKASKKKPTKRPKKKPE